MLARFFSLPPKNHDAIGDKDSYLVYKIAMPVRFETAPTSDASISKFFETRKGTIWILPIAVFIRVLFMLKLMANATLHPAWAMSVAANGMDILLLMHIVQTCRKAPHRTAYISDCLLVVQGLFMPAFHCTRVLLLNGESDWTAFTWFFGITAAYLQQPGPHLFMGWLFSTPVYLALDHYSQCTKNLLAATCDKSQISFNALLQPR